ncbi:MAG TPA: DUF4266 domain-containing protein [Saprospiraceae bacterium]|jgi:hypothetical protein|nr:DUF4266 domain-containing protein [Saprospiraceae bacterium]MBK6665602.1 DUF4266 domain-containing protein [Saprospiraceae bacterium]MBK9582488.1 DUF4266 domain-containing protein [Saprospiraceae bacterium]HQV67064.1 DUF4266 domain-containing protein [Saprospiraceae bacterium]HQV96770.1 DUF4266 domain-containing protein [Saprospiraceae bacterium]
MNTFCKSRLFIPKALLFCMLVFTSCSTVKSSEKAYLNDGEMPLSLRKLEKLEINFQLYREGSSGATGGKSGGGCGCN